MKRILILTIILSVLTLFLGCYGQATQKETDTPSPKPESLLASDSEYSIVYSAYTGWFGEGSFSTRYEKSVNDAVTNNWTSFWMGSEEDKNKRINFDRVGDQWQPRFNSGINTILSSEEIPPKPDSMFATDVEYELYYRAYNDWFGEGSFSTRYEKSVNDAVTNSWTSFWMGSEEDKNKRINFDRVGDQWQPRTSFGLLFGAANYIGAYPKPAMVNYTAWDGQSGTVYAFPGQLEVFFQKSITPTSAEKIIQDNGGSVIEQIPLLGYYLVNVKPGSEAAFTASMLQHQEVTLAQPNTAASAQEEFHINEDFITSAKPVPLNVQPGIIALDYFVQDEHGPGVLNAATKNGGSVGSAIEIGIEPGSGGTSADKVKMAIIAAAEGNRIFNSGEPTILNLSSQCGPNRDYDILSISERQSAQDAWENFTRSLAYAVAALPSSIQDNIVITNSAGNSRMPISQPLENLRIDPALSDILDKHFLFVTTTLRGEQTLAYPWGEFSNFAPGDFDVAVINNPEAIEGTSFASPAAAAVIQQVKNKTGISLQDTLQAVKMAVLLNARHELILEEAIREANLLKKTETSTPAPRASPGVTPSPTPKPTGTPSSVEASVTIDSMSYKLLNSQYDSQGYYWVEVSASGTAIGPVDAIMFLIGDASPVASGWLPVSSLDSWTQLENGKMIKRENGAETLTSWSTSGKIPITWTQWHNFPNIELALNAEVQNQQGDTLATATDSIPLEQPAQAR